MSRNALLIIFSIFSALVVTGSSFHAANGDGSGAPSGNTGSPADNKTCARSGCHPGTATNITDAISSDVPATGYIPGNTYTITATVNDPSLIKFGFEISPQSSTGTLLGTLALLDADKTKFTSNANKYITHKSAGTSWPGHTASWSFSWTAPLAGTGDVTFYGAFNFSNNNGSTSGDVIHTSTLTIPEAFGVGIAAIDAEKGFALYPNPVSSDMQVSYYLPHTMEVSISIYDLSGKRLAILKQETEPEGNYHSSYTLTGYSKGAYIIELKTGYQSFAQKLIKL